MGANPRCGPAAAAGTIGGMDYKRGVQIGIIIALGIMLLVFGTCFLSMK
jgi:hypothetical protein